MERFTLNAQSRAAAGKGAARKVRKTGGTVGIVYRSGESATPIAFNAAELATIFRKTSNPNVIIDVVMDGAARACVVQDVQRHPVSRAVEHVDFYEVRPGDVVSVSVPVKAVGRAVGTRTGGTLRMLTRAVNVSCDPFLVPATLDVDVTPLNVGDFFRASQVPAPEGVKVVYRQDFNLFTVEGKRSDKTPAEEAAAAAGDAKGGKPAAKPAAKK